MSRPSSGSTQPSWSLWATSSAPEGIAIDDHDRIVVTDGIRCRLQVYTKDKDYLEPQYNL